MQGDLFSALLLNKEFLNKEFLNRTFLSGLRLIPLFR